MMRREDEPSDVPPDTPSQGIGDVLKKVLDERDATIEAKGGAAMAGDTITRYETDAKLDALAARTDLSINQALEKLHKDYLAPIQLDHAGLKRDMDWVRNMFIGVYIAAAIALGTWVLSSISKTPFSNLFPGNDRATAAQSPAPTMVSPIKPAGK